MTNAIATRDLFMPRSAGGIGRGVVLALLVHGLLIAGLAVGVNWRTSNPQGMQAELWAAVPQVAAPRAASPEPRVEAAPVLPVSRPPPVEPERATPPEKLLPDPQIAIAQARREERARRLEEEREERLKKEAGKKLAQAEKLALAEKTERAEQKRKDLEEQRDKEKERAEAKRLVDAREAAVKRMLSQAGGTAGEAGSTGQAAHNAAPSAGYTGRVIARIKPNIVFIDDLAANPEAEVLVRLAPDGRIISQKLVRSSGSREWDQAVQRAIERTEILPRDTDGRVPQSMVIAFKPRE